MDFNVKGEEVTVRPALELCSQERPWERPFKRIYPFCMILSEVFYKQLLAVADFESDVGVPPILV